MDSAESGMTRKDIIILECPSNLGLIEPAPGREPGVKKLPGWLRKFRFQERLQPLQEYSISPPPYSMEVDPESGVRNAGAIVAYAKEQAAVLSNLVHENHFLVTIGGDCSILVGNTLALKKKGNYGLFFLDGHTDFMLPELSGTKGAAGMDLAIVTGHAHPKLSNIFDSGPYITEQNTWCVGNREYDETYVKTIKNSRIRYYDLDHLRATGIENCCRSFLEIVYQRNLEGFWIHLDVDVLDDSLMPAVDSRAEGGLDYGELKSILSLLICDEKARGLEITILDPELDREGIFTDTFVDAMVGVLRKQK